jgi:hypothetical protein
VGFAMRKFLIASSAALTCLATGAVAAEQSFQLLDISGKVLVNSGKGFAPAEANQALNEADQVFVGKNAVARVSIPEIGCTATLPENKVSVMNAKALCKDPKITPAAYEGVPGEIPPVVIVGGIVAISAGAFIYALTEDGTPVSGAP